MLRQSFDLFVVQSVSLKLFTLSLHSINVFFSFRYYIYQKDQLSEARFNSEIKLIVYKNRDNFGRALLLSIIVFLA